jgi:hypothetical protein
MKTGPIKAQRYETTIDRRKEIIAEAWVRQSAPEPVAKLAWFGTPVAPAKPKQSPVLLVTTTKTIPDGLKALIKAHLEAGGRAYLLTPPSFDPAAELKSLTDAEKAQVLLRQLPRASQSGYYHTVAGIWYAPLGDRATRLHLRLSSEQAEEWRHLFLRAFWHEAEKEQHFAKGKWTAGEACWNRPADISPRELTFWQTSPDDQEARQRIPAAEVAHCQQATKPGAAALYTKPDFNAADLLNAAAAKGVQIYGLSSQLPECYLQDASGWLICGDKEAYVLKLSPEQAREARGLLALSQSQAYLRDRDLASLQKDFPAAEYLLPEAKDWERIVGQWPVDKGKDLGRVTARSLQDLGQSELRWEANDQKLRCPELAMAAHFTWEVVPPTATSKNEDPLYDAWKQHTQACTALKEKLVNRTRDLSELNSGWDGEFTKCFEDASALKISFGKLTALGAEDFPAEWRPGPRQALMHHLQAWLEECGHARKLLNHALLVQDWLNAKRKLQGRITAIQSQLAEVTSAKPQGDNDVDDSHPPEDQRDDLSKLRVELARLRNEMHAKYSSAPSDKEEHAELKAHRPLDIFAIKPCPQDHLPAVGKLYAGKGPGGQTARYLAIADWSDHEEGLKEAGRLKASLVAETP